MYPKPFLLDVGKCRQKLPFVGSFGSKERSLRDAARAFFEAPRVFFGSGCGVQRTVVWLMHSKKATKNSYIVCATSEREGEI